MLKIMIGDESLPSRRTTSRSPIAIHTLFKCRLRLFSVCFAQLSGKRRVTVHQFKDIPMVDIREYYGGAEDPKPGAKGELRLLRAPRLTQRVLR